MWMHLISTRLTATAFLTISLCMSACVGEMTGTENEALPSIPVNQDQPHKPQPLGDPNTTGDATTQQNPQESSGTGDEQETTQEPEETTGDGDEQETTQEPEETTGNTDEQETTGNTDEQEATQEPEETTGDEQEPTDAAAGEDSIAPLVEGYYAIRTQLPANATVPNVIGPGAIIRITNVSYGLGQIRKEDNEFKFYETFCRYVSFSDDPSTLTYTFPEAYVNSIPPKVASVTFEGNEESMTYIVDGNISTVGARLEDIVSDELPTRMDDDRVWDQDGDGKPGGGDSAHDHHPEGGGECLANNPDGFNPHPEQ